MALEVHHVETGEIAEVRSVERHDVTQPAFAGSKTVDPVVTRREMDWNARLPVQEIRAALFIHGAVSHRSCAHAGNVGHRGLTLLHLQFDVDAGGEVEALQGLDGLAGRFHDVDQTLVDAHLEVLAAVLVDVR